VRSSGCSAKRRCWRFWTAPSRFPRAAPACCARRPLSTGRCRSHPDRSRPRCSEVGSGARPTRYQIDVGVGVCGRARSGASPSGHRCVGYPPSRLAQHAPNMRRHSLRVWPLPATASRGICRHHGPVRCAPDPQQGFQITFFQPARPVDISENIDLDLNVSDVASSGLGSGLLIRIAVVFTLAFFKRLAPKLNIFHQ
jgi:hypothetical protein